MYLKKKLKNQVKKIIEINNKHLQFLQQNIVYFNFSYYRKIN